LPADPSTKRKLSEKVDRPPKKPEVMTGPNASETPAKLPAKPGSEVGKGPVPVTEELLVLLREDSSYALKQILSIIEDDDYSDLGNHAT